MQPILWVELILGFVGLLCAFASFVMTLYLGRQHVRAVDKIAMGFEPQEDSLFMLMLRVPNYGLAFIWPFYAKRAGLLEIRDSFDKKFKRLFIINFWLPILSIVALVIAINIKKYFID